jgi:hypothetical protein
MEFVLSRFEDNCILWFSIFSLIFTGVVIQRIFWGMDIPAVISFFSSVATILGFILALVAYCYWRQQGTKSEQAKLVREIMMFVAELELSLEFSFDSCILEEQENDGTIYPSLEQRKLLSKVKELIESINILMVKFYAIEPNPHNYLLNNSKAALLTICYENESFESLKQYLMKVGCLLRYTKGDNTLSFNNYIFSSSLPNEKHFNVSILFGGANSFVQLALFFSDTTRSVERDLRRHIN